MCRSPVMDAVSTFKIHKIVTLVKIVYGSQLVTSADVHGVEINKYGAVTFTFQLLQPQEQRSLKADSHIACRAHAVPLPCRAANGLECVFPIWFTQCGSVWFTLALPRPCHALTMPFFSRPRHSTAVDRRPVGYLPAFGFFRILRGVPRRLLPEAYQSSSQRSIPTTVKSGKSTVQKRRSVKLMD